jgi:serine/threonine protein kinase
MSSTDSTQKISRYAILSRLGEGGIGVVYKAFDPNLNKIVAIKVLNTGTLRADQHVRFQNEARALAELKHTAIPEIYNFSISEDGAPYMVMEFIEGKSLSQLLSEQKKLSVDNALAIAKQVCNALQSAHSMGIFHRDVTPSNIIIDVEGEVKLVDFGLVKFEKYLDQYQTKTGKVIGSPAYMSPEQIRTLPIDGRTDIYSMGCVLFEMLSGRTPYSAESAMEMVSSHLSSEIPTLPEDQSIDQLTLSKLQKIIYRCLAKAPDDRFQKMGELESALEELSRAETKPLFIDTTTNTKRPLPILAIGLILFAVFFGVTTWLLQQNREAQPVSTTKPIKKDHPLTTLEPIGEKLSKQIRPFFITSGRKAAMASKDDLKDEDFAWLRKHPESDKIHIVRVNYSRVTGSGLRDLNGMNLEKLKLISPCLQSESLHYLRQFPEMRELSIGGTNLNVAAYKEIASLKNLSLLKLMEMDIPDKALPLLAPLEDLSALFIVSNASTKRFHADYKSLPSLHRLTQLEIKSFDFSNKDLVYVSKMKNLTHLALENMDIDDSNLELLQTLPELQIVNLSNTNIKAKGLDAIGKIKKLAILIIRGCKNLSEARIIAFKHVHPAIVVQRSTYEASDLGDLAD